MSAATGRHDPGHLPRLEHRDTEQRLVFAQTAGSIALMPTSLRSALDRLEAALAAQGNPLVRGLLPGLSEDAIRARLAEFGLDPPEDLVTLFEWHDGNVGPVIGASIGPAILLLTFDDACGAYERRVRFDLNTLVEHTDWADGVEWFPVLLHGTGYLVVDCRTGSPTRGCVSSYFGLEMTEAQYRPASLAEPVMWWAEHLESGAWRWDPSTGCIIDTVDVRTLPWNRVIAGMG